MRNWLVGLAAGSMLTTGCAFEQQEKDFGEDIELSEASVVGGLPCDISGDVNGDGTFNIADPSYFGSFLFQGGPPPVPSLHTGDFNCDAAVDITDVSVLGRYLNFVFGGDATAIPKRFLYTNPICAAGQCTPSGCPSFCHAKNCFGEHVVVWFDEALRCTSETLAE